jgi:hypothetical protein
MSAVLLADWSTARPGRLRGHAPNRTQAGEDRQADAAVPRRRHRSITNAAAAGTSPAALMAPAPDFKTTQGYIDLAGPRSATRPPCSRSGCSGRNPGRSSLPVDPGDNGEPASAGFPLQTDGTERRRSRTYRAVGCTTAPVLKTGWATGPVPLPERDPSLRRVPAHGPRVRHHASRRDARLSTRTSPARLVTPSTSSRSRRSCAGRREMPSRSRNRASSIEPARSHSATAVSRACV